ncbi:hypothetical protein T11_10030 [Trichinella zimbabwensis]|uniref:DUF5641 domain-containing protein n=1 Tax=Trichinella zimbabwensis TaxID=268475 RepID=A0A0V1HKY8_9BILA|nr:hypothetical protein T11_10030 [Trichinella zimbabwensis]
MATIRSWAPAVEPAMALPSAAHCEMVVKMETDDATTEMESFPAGPQVNHLVLILEDNIPRTQCLIGVITELPSGSDGIARVAKT